MRNSLIHFLSLMALSLILASSVHGQTPLSNGESTNQILDSLVKMHQAKGAVFIEQKQLDPLIRVGGGGACPSAAALMVYQAMRVTAGLEVDTNPHRAVLNAFANDSSLLDGRLTNSQFVKLLKYYESLLEGASIEITTVSAPNSPHATNDDTWGAPNSLKLNCEPGEIKVLSYTVTRESGEVLGRHFVILKSVHENHIQVIDPTAPTKERGYVIDHRKEGGDRVFLRYPPDVGPRQITLELNTIFEVRVTPILASGKLTPTESTPVARIQREIDSIAEKLAGRNELRSPRKWRSEGANVGLTSLDLPADCGGANWPATKMIEVFRHAGRFDLNLRDVVGAAHARVLLYSEAPEVKDIVQQVADGDAYIAIAITEPNFGSDFTSMESVCEKVDGGYILNGQKQFNARLDQASHVIVFTKSNTGRKGRMNVFVLPLEVKGLTVKRFGAHGLTGNSYGGLELNDVFVPDSHRIGEEDEGYVIFNSHFRYWRLMQTATALGTAERSLEMMADRLASRNVYGRPIGRFTHLQQPLGQHSTELRMAYALAVKAAESLDQGDYEKADLLICGLKAEGVEIALSAVDATARAFGAEGYSDLVDIGDRLRDLNGLRIADGTTDVLRSAVVAKTFGSEFWEMAIKPRDEDPVVPPAK